ncbi:MAG: MFS transporter [Acidimicrobiales bacterium]
MVSLETTIIALAFPEIVDAFPGSSPRTLSWVLTAYNVGVASFLLSAGYWADRAGRKKVFLIGVAIFATGSALATLAWSGPALIAARIIQSIGGAVQYPAGLALLLDAHPPERRRAAIGVWGAMGAMAAAAGPSMGGLLIDAFNWRAIFAINVPVAIGTIALGHTWLRERSEPPASGSVDLIGVPMASIGVGAIVLGIVQIEVWGASIELATTFAAGCALLLVFIIRSVSHAAPLLDLALFRIRTYAVGNIGAVAFTLGFFAWLVTLPTFIQEVWGWGIRKTGFALALSPLIAMVASILGGRIADKVGVRTLLVVSGAAGVTGMLLHRILTGQNPSLVIGLWLPGMFVGLGAGLGFSMNVAAIMGDVPQARFGMAGAGRTTIFQLATAIGFAVGFAIIAGDLGSAALLGRMRIVWVVSAALYGIQTLVYLFVFPRTPSAR